MKKIHALLLSASMVTLFACGGTEEKKTDGKEEKNEEEPEATVEEKKEPEVDYSYIIPKIDTAALTSETEIIDAMQKVVKARKMDDSLSGAVSSYAGYYAELTTLYTAVQTKGNSYMNTLKPKEAVAFSEKFSAAQQ